MSTYHPLEDANHCLYRMILLMRNLDTSVGIELFRLMDFYLLFPACLKEITLPRPLRRYKRALKEIPNQFEVMPNKVAVFDRLRHVQNNALRCLVSIGFIDKRSFLEGQIVRTEQAIPPNVAERIEKNPIASKDWFRFLTKEMPAFPTAGDGGWKARTHLIEYKNDAA